MNFSKVSLVSVSPVALVALMIRSNMNFDMFYKIFLEFKGLAAMVALKWFLPRVCLDRLLRISNKFGDIM